MAGGYLGDTLSSSFLSNTTTSIIYQYSCTIPLCYIHDFYAKLPGVQNSLGFELKLQLNAGSNNSYTVNYTCVAGTAFTAPEVPSSIAANQGVGNTCPFMLSQACTNKGTGLSIMPGAGTTCSVAITSAIGWLNGGTANTTNPCRIYVPQISYTPSYTSMLLKQPKFKMLYEDFYVDQVLGIDGNGLFEKDAGVVPVLRSPGV